MGSCDPVESDEVVSFASPVISSDDDQDITNQRAAPRALDLWCGCNSPIARALAWCGWEVDGYDIAIHSSHDLLSPRLQDELLQNMAIYDVVYARPPTVQCPGQRTCASRGAVQPPCGPRTLRRATSRLKAKISSGSLERTRQCLFSCNYFELAWIILSISSWRILRAVISGTCRQCGA